MGVSATTAVSFAEIVVTGASLTERARELMAEGNWKLALSYLTNGLEGLSYEQAISIIEGDRKLVGHRVLRCCWSRRTRKSAAS